MPTKCAIRTELFAPLKTDVYNGDAWKALDAHRFDCPTCLQKYINEVLPIVTNRVWAEAKEEMARARLSELLIPMELEKEQVMA